MYIHYLVVDADKAHLESPYTNAAWELCKRYNNWCNLYFCTDRAKIDKDLRPEHQDLAVMYFYNLRVRLEMN